MNNRPAHHEPLIFFAGAWFAMAFSLPLLVFWSGAGDSVAYFLVFVLLPALIAFAAGEGVGSDILYRDRVPDSGQAAVKGVKVALAGCLLYAPLAALGWAVYLSLYERDQHEWLTVQFFENILTNLIYFGCYGAVFFLWLYALLGAVTGWLLFKFRVFREENP